MQHCDATCGWCARNFFAWLKARIKSQDREVGRSGAGSFNAAAATSIHPESRANHEVVGPSDNASREVVSNSS